MSTASIEEHLSRQTFFAGLNPEWIALLADHARDRELERNHLLFQDGDPARTFYLLRSGRVTVEIPAIAGPTLEVQTLGDGEVLGWSWLIPPYRWSFQGRAEDPTSVLEFDGETLLRHCEADPVLGYALLKRFSTLMSKRLEAARQIMIDEWNPPGFA